MEAWEKVAQQPKTSHQSVPVSFRPAKDIVTCLALFISLDFDAVYLPNAGRKAK